LKKLFLRMLYPPKISLFLVPFSFSFFSLCFFFLFPFLLFFLSFFSHNIIIIIIILKSLKIEGGEETLLNTKFELSMPRFMSIDFANQIRKEEKIGGGGSAITYRGIITDPTLSKVHFLFSFSFLFFSFLFFSFLFFSFLFFSFLFFPFLSFSFYSGKKKKKKKGI